ncbi:MgtC/SapB family protein [Cellulosilyticum sp. I15G10I2]|uniref:MgtC/SapB family protein n=1 Tax=Cellulosilyticum sp. I15G10I2 TaxID=1892843 RepID=UPI00085CCB35|nr:MgtC/SapB family protein [Cellulosilyticum sp. I15G10I2]
MQNIGAYLNEVNILSIIVRLVLACLCGGIIGFDRIKKRRPAGLKTHILVCIGATLAMITNQYIFNVYGEIVDPARLGAQVISGIGFLGAGTIIVTGRQQIRGLTTAAGLWASATMGLAIGIGFYSAAIIGCIFIFIVMTVVQKVDNMIVAKSPILEIYMEFSNIENVRVFIDLTKTYELKILGIQLTEPSKYNAQGVGALLTIQTSHNENHADIMALLRSLDGVLNVEDVAQI